MKDKLIIIGAGGHGRAVADIALKMNQWESIYFLDDDETMDKSMGIAVIGSSQDASKYIKDHDIFVAIGNNHSREKVQRMLEDWGASIPTMIHPKSIIGEKVKIGLGTVLMAGVIVNSCTTIGKGCIINTASTIGHDNILEDYVHVSSGSNLAGTVTVGKNTWIGIGSIVINNIQITKGCKIGAGSLVIRSIEEPGTYVGSPVRKL